MLLIFFLSAAIQLTQITFSVPQEKMLPIPEPNKVIAKLNGKELQAKEVEKFLWDWFGNQTLQILIGAAMMEDAAKEAGVTVEHEEIVAQVEQQIGHLRARVPPGKTLEDQLRLQGTSYTRYYMQARADLLGRKIVLKNFNPEDLRQLSQILIRPKGNEAKDKEEAKLRAQQAYNQIKGGESWQNAVMSFTDDPTTKANGGRLGWVSISELPEEARAPIKQLEQGEICGPFDTPYGFVIFRVDAIGPPTGNELEVAKNRFLSRRLMQLYREINEKAKVENFLLPSGDKSDKGKS